MARTHVFFGQRGPEKRTKITWSWSLSYFPDDIAWKGLLLCHIIGTEGARRRPLTYDDHPIPSHPSVHPKSLSIIETGLRLISVNLKWCPLLCYISLLTGCWNIAYVATLYMGGGGGADCFCHCRGRVSGSILIFYGMLCWNWGSRAEFTIPGDQSRLMLSLILIDDDSLPALWLSSFFFEGSILEL